MQRRRQRENGSRLHVNQILGLIRGSLRKKALATHKMLSSARQSKNYANLCVCAMGVAKILSQFSLILASRKIYLEARKRKFTNLLFFCFLIKLTRIFVSSARVICCQNSFENWFCTRVCGFQFKFADDDGRMERRSGKRWQCCCCC